MQRRLTDWVSVSLRVDYQQWNDIRGKDDALDVPALGRPIVPTAFPDLRGGERLDVLLGANFLVGHGPLAGHRLALEAGVPAYQDLDGPQLETDWLFTLGWQYAF